MNLDEDVPVTTTDNAGSGLDLPKLPLKAVKTNIFRRVKELSDKNKIPLKIEFD